MRPVNLIPAEERRGAHSQLRTGPLPYIVLGALALTLIGVAMLVTTDNHIAESKAEAATLKREDAAAQAKAKRLAAYSQFRTLAEQRVATVRSLADSRFDWERVMHELSLVLPGNVWLTSLSASATPTTSVGGGEGGGEASGLRGAIAGPALEMSGCATGQEAVAEFVTALKNIDGVTRVGLGSSELAGKSAEGGSGGGSGDCRTRSFIAQFSLVVAFDAAPVAVEGGEEGEEVTASAETTPEEGSSEGAGG
jgi:Tfp pilus assembly protein PilN